MRVFFSLLVLLMTLGFSVPMLQDYDYFIWLRNTGELYSTVKKLPLFEFLLSKEGVGYEQTTVKWLENHVDQPDSFFQTLSEEIIVCGRGDIKDLFTFDINDLFSLPCRFKEGFIAFRTNTPQKFVKFFAKVNTAEFYEKDGLYIIESTTPLYLKTLGEYILLSPNEEILGRVQNEKVALKNAPIVAHMKKFDLLGREGEAVLSVKVNDSQLTLEITQKAMPFSTSKPDSLGQLPYIGDLYAFTGDPEISRELLREIFKGSDFEEFYQTFIDSNITLMTSLYGAPELVLFVRSKSLEDVETHLISRGAKKIGEEWELPTQNALLHFFEYRGYLVISSMKKIEFLQAINKRRLSNHPSFRFFEKRVPDSAFLEMFIDLNSILNKLLGFSPKSSLFLVGYVDGGTIKYRLEVM